MVRNHLKNPLGNKRGFTLVELMIVIVIMGILVAVAIPIYGAVTATSEKRACQANCEIIEKAAIQYMLNQNKDDLKDITGVSQIEVTPTVIAQFPIEFMQSFNNGFPACSKGGTYTLVLDVANSGKTLTVVCSETSH
ncbi:MAG: type II secretion system protein, partial [Oscillospiraceae bacterium]